MALQKPAGRRRADRPRHAASPHPPKLRGRRRATPPTGRPSRPWVKPATVVLTTAGLLAGALPAHAHTHSSPVAQNQPEAPEGITADPKATLNFGKTALSSLAGPTPGIKEPSINASGSVQEEAAPPASDPVVDDAEKAANAAVDNPGIFLGAPLSSMSTASGFGYRLSPLTGASELHTGLDLAASCSTQKVLASQNGTVVEAGWSQYGGGNRIVIDHGNGLKSTYNHLSVIGAFTGQAVGRGELIGNAGTTGNSTGCHLHFEVLLNDAVVDPFGWL